VTKRWVAEIVVMPKTGVNDPEGEAILGGLHDLGYDVVSRVRAGRQFRVELAAADAAQAMTLTTEMTDRLLANPVIQSFAVARLDELDGTMEDHA
jgi:phosphoribosylformylglycinamidine synthase